MNVFINFLKQNSLILLTISGLITLGAAVNSLVPWEYLTYFFVILRNLIATIDFIIPTDHLIILIIASFAAYGALWTYKGYIWVVNWHKNH